MNTWKLTYDKFVPTEEKLREALCTLGNGYFGTRGAASEITADSVHYPGTYIAGVYNELVTKIAGRDVPNEDFVNCPNWLLLTYRIGNGPWFEPLRAKLLSWKTELNMRKGMFSRRLRWEDDQGRITLVECHRIVSMANPHYAALRCTIVPENYSGTVTIRSGIDGHIINAGVERYKQLKSKHLEPHAHGVFGDDGIYLQMQTNQSKIQISEALRTLVYCGDKRITPAMRVRVHKNARIIQEFTIDVKKGKKYTIEKLVSIYTSRDRGVTDNCAMAKETVQSVENFESLYKPHRARWSALWKRFDIEVEGDDFVQMVLRLHMFHLLQVASTYNEEIDAGLPARGLHGEAYRGHIFWDEMFVLPLYNLRAPEITRSVLMYRYRRLDRAKEYARQHGYRGAMYPWQSASAGNETTQVVHLNPMSGKWGDDYSSLQRHVSIAIAFNIWNYYKTTGHSGFMDRYGAETLLEIAHFWSSISTYNAKIKRYEIKGVMGPDEFHEKYPNAKKGGLNNNAYTNVLATWVISKALRWLDTTSEAERQALLLKIGVDDKEIERWRDITKRMKVAIDKKGIIHQFDRYMDLKELDWDKYRSEHDNIGRIDRILKAEGLSPDSYKAAKQADALMIFYVLGYDDIKKIFQRLGYRLTREIVKKNYDYYVKRTSHGSTLSRVAHGYLAAQIGYEDEAIGFLTYALRSDIYDTQGGTTIEGIHCGVMGGTIDIFLRCFAGVKITDEGVALEPKLPRRWKRLKFQFRYKNTWFHVMLAQKKISILAKPLRGSSLRPSAEIPISVKGKTYKLSPGKAHAISL